MENRNRIKYGYSLVTSIIQSFLRLGYSFVGKHAIHFFFYLISTFQFVQPDIC